MRRGMTSILAIGGIALAVTQIMRRRTRRSGMNMIGFQMNQFFNQMMERSSQIMRTARRRTRI